jgi:hypothetical protein
MKLYRSRDYSMRWLSGVFHQRHFPLAFTFELEHQNRHARLQWPYFQIAPGWNASR